MSLNKVMIIGNVGSDPEIKYANEAKVATIKVATSEKYKDRSGELHEKTEWHSIVAWRTAAEIMEKYVTKGSLVYIEGKLRTRQWEDKNGCTRYSTEVVVDTIQTLGKKQGQDGDAGASLHGVQHGAVSAPEHQQPHADYDF